MRINLLLNGLSALCSNCYGVLSNKAAIVIDPGRCTDDIVDFLNRNSDKERLILLTHAHFDHIGGAKELREKTGVEIAVGADEAESLHTLEFNLSERFRSPLTDLYADKTFSDKEICTVGDLHIKTIFTPGHTKGSVCYLIENTLFSGDTLFYETVGRTDLPSGSSESMRKSLKKLFKTLSDDIAVYPGHGGETDIYHERIFNPYAE